MRMDIVATRAFLARARVLSASMERRQLIDATGLLTRAGSAVRRHSEAAFEDARARLAAYDGLPIRFNPLDVLGVGHREASYSNLLAWLLNPDADHGLGDRFLKRFLASVGSTRLLSFAASHAPVEAVVHREAKIDTGFVDILLVLRRHLVPIECKVFSVEGSHMEDGMRVSQTQYYRQRLEAVETRSACLKMPVDRALAGTRPDITGVYVRRRGAARADDDQTLTISWMDIDVCIADVLTRCAVEPEVRRLLMAFRSVLLTSSGAVEPLMTLVERLRLLADSPSARAVDPIGTYLELQHFLNPEDGDE